MSPYTMYMILLQLGEFSPLLHFVYLPHKGPLDWISSFTSDQLLKWAYNLLAAAEIVFRVFFNVNMWRPHSELNVWHGENVLYQIVLGVSWCKTREFKWGMKLCQELLNSLLIMRIILYLILHPLRISSRCLPLDHNLLFANIIPKRHLDKNAWQLKWTRHCMNIRPCNLIEKVGKRGRKLAVCTCNVISPAVLEWTFLRARDASVNSSSVHPNPSR